MTDIIRHSERKINKLLKMFPAVAIIGARQVGKTCLAKKIGFDWTYMDLENSDDLDRIQDDPKFFFKNTTSKIIIDEAQSFPEIFNILRGVIDEDRKQKGRFIITGSSSYELTKRISESLAGRIAVVELGTLSCREKMCMESSKFYECFEQKLSNNTLKKLQQLDSSLSRNDVNDSFFKGGYPEPVLADDGVFYKNWMAEYFKNYINRDIRSLFPGLNIVKYRRFVQMLTSIAGSLINKAELARSLDISQTTARDYLDISHGSFVWRNIFSYEKASSKSLVKMPKGGFRDSGLLHYLMKISEQEELLNHYYRGRLFENYVIEEIIKGFNNSMVTGLIPYYFRTKNGAEVDLVLDGDFGLIPIEIKIGMKTNKKQLVSLENFIVDNDCKFGILVNNGERIDMLSEQIIQIPVGYL